MRHGFSLLIAWSAAWIACGSRQVEAFAPGDLVRTSKKETLLFLGDPFLAAPKGQEFLVLEHNTAQRTVALAFVQKEGAVIAVTLPEASLEAVPLDGWGSLLRGTQLFQDQKFDEATKLIQAAAASPDFRPLAARVAGAVDAFLQTARPAYQALTQAQSANASGLESAKARLAPAQTAFAGAVAKMHALVAEVDKQGFTSPAFFLDDGVQRLASRLIPPGFAANGAEIPQPPYARQDLAARAAKAAFAVVRCRQATAVRRQIEAAQYAEEGLAAEPARPDLQKMRLKIQEDIQDAEGRADAAEQNRKRNLTQALLALERGIKYCADHPRLAKLREDMSGVLEQKSAPRVTPEFMAAARSPSPQSALVEGHQLYTSRCAQCHELEMLDSRSLSGWKNEVSRMAGRAKLSASQQTTVMDYIAAAMNTLEKR